MSYLAISQKVDTSEREVFETKEIVFYGYDYADFKIADLKRLDEDLKFFFMTG